MNYLSALTILGASTVTFEEVIEELGKYDEIALLELLGITSSDIIDKFKDDIISNYPYIYYAVTDTPLEKL